MASFLKHRSLIFCISLLLILATCLAACGSSPAQPGENSAAVQVEVIAPVPTLTVPSATAVPSMTLVPSQTSVPAETPTVDPFVLTLTAYPTFPDTPTPTTGEPKEGPTPTITPTPSKIVDLSAGALITRTMVYVVKRADGSFEKYLIADTLIPPDETRQKVRDQLLNLGPQDVIVDSHPLDSLPMVPPALTPPEISATAVP